jgi:hypothetical protein
MDSTGLGFENQGVSTQNPIHAENTFYFTAVLDSSDGI